MRRFFNGHAAPSELGGRSLKQAVSEALECRVLLNATLTSPITSPVLNPTYQAEVINLSNHFDNPDGTGVLTYNASSSVPGVVQVSVLTTGAYSGELLLQAGYTGASEVTVKATDNGGHSASTMFPVMVGKNTAILTLTAPANGSTVSTFKPTFSGTAATGNGYSSKIEINIAGGIEHAGETAALTATARGGKFSVTPSSPLPTFTNGAFQVFAMQAELSGDAIGIFDSFNIYVDTVKPTATLVPSAEITTDSFTSGGVEVYFGDADSTLVFDSVGAKTISVTGPSGQPVPISIFTDLITTTGLIDANYVITAPDPNGEWTSALNGTYTISLNSGVVDDAGNTLDPVADFGTFVVDIPPALPPKLTGATIGTSGSFKNDGNTIAKATDGNLSTFFDGPTANGNWVGVDLGSSGGVVKDIAYASRSGYASRMNGGIFQASDSSTFSSGVVNLYTLSSNANPSSTVLTTRAISNTKAYRYYRYLSPAGSYGDVAEVQFFGTAGGLSGATKLTGTTIGTAGSYENDGNTIARATDGNLSTFFDGPTANGNWVGLDLGSSKTIGQISYAPRSGFASQMIGGEIQISTTANFTSGVTTIYTIKTTPTVGALTTISLSSPVTARYIRYLSPSGSDGDISEFQVFS